MRRNAVIAVVAIACVLAGCSKDSTTSSSTTTTPPTTAPTTTSTVPGQTVTYNFATTATPEQATQAADVMTKRLVNDGFPGSTATVNSAGTGLTIVVVGATSPENAKQIVDPLTIHGALYFRPVLQGPIAPASTETASPNTATILDQLIAAGVQSIPGTGITTTAAADDNPAGESVLIQPDADKAVVARWQVGPQQVDATAITDTNVTTYNGVPAVQIVMKTGTPGIDQFNAMASACFAKQATCPTNIYTVVFDSLVATAASVQTGSASFTPFSTTGVIIWSPDWTQDQAKVFAAVVKVGELPVALVAA